MIMQLNKEIVSHLRCNERDETCVVNINQKSITQIWQATQAYNAT